MNPGFLFLDGRRHPRVRVLVALVVMLKRARMPIELGADLFDAPDPFWPVVR